MTFLKECDDPALESHLYRCAGYFYLNDRNNVPLTTELLGKALAAAQICNDGTLQSRALFFIALTDWRVGNYVMGQRHASEAHRLGRLSGNLYGEGMALYADGMCCRELGDYVIAVELFNRSRNCLARCGVAGGRADTMVMTSLAELRFFQSEYSEVYQIYTTIVQDAVLSVDTYLCGFSLLHIAQIDVIIGTPAHEVQHKINKLKEVLTTLQDINTQQAVELVSADLSLRERNHAHAQAVFTRYLHMFLGNNAEYALYANERLADLERWETQYFDKTFIWATIYLSYAFKLGNKLAVHKALACIGQMYLVQCDLETAHNLFTVALKGFTQMGVHHSKAQCLLYLGNIAEQEGNLGKAAELWTTARPLFERTLQAKNVEKIDAKLANLVEEQVTTNEECMDYSKSVSVKKSQSRLSVGIM
ncbi:hypothetical protein R3P38DRAFT_2810620 [Favolaschia claudopus]|uniref:Tetratricopeptide repeat protein 29 n=1 Tax=Favolaschia claudopus TaxID=2862362 RepID=A0AAV9ZAM1_9AGAR